MHKGEGSICCTYHQLKYSCPNRYKKEPHKRTYLSENGGLGEQKSGEWAKSIKRCGIKSNRTRLKNKRGFIIKWYQTERLEIPERGRHQKSPASLPGGGWEGGGGIHSEANIHVCVCEYLSYLEYKFGSVVRNTPVSPIVHGMEGIGIYFLKGRLFCVALFCSG